jgi:hypothetical protein
MMDAQHRRRGTPLIAYQSEESGAADRSEMPQAKRVTQLRVVRFKLQVVLALMLGRI